MFISRKTYFYTQIQKESIKAFREGSAIQPSTLNTLFKIFLNI